VEDKMKAALTRSDTPPAKSTSTGGDRRVTYYVAMPFAQDLVGNLAAGEAIELQSARSAIAAAHAMALKHGGGVSFSRT
jgi:hypothetical protein